MNQDKSYLIERYHKIKEITNKVAMKVKELFRDEKFDHDLSHLQRTCELAYDIQVKEGGDLQVILLSAILHDVHRLREKDTKEICTPADSLPIIADILKRAGFDDNISAQVLHAIEFHEQYGFTEEGKNKEENIETKILQDADNLDALGAIGIARALIYGAKFGDPIWDPKTPIEPNQKYDPNEKDPSTIHHFVYKLYRLADDMNTQSAKKIASKRVELMKNFAEAIMIEIGDGESIF